MEVKLKIRETKRKRVQISDKICRLRNSKIINYRRTVTFFIKYFNLKLKLILINIILNSKFDRLIAKRAV